MPKDVAGHQVLTAQDLDPMTPEEWHAAFDGHTVTGRDDYPTLVVRGILLRAICVIGQLDTTWPDEGAGTDHLNDAAES